MKDIAKSAGVSVCTVSLVLNGKAKNRVSERNARKVLDVARELGYVPNSTARTLRMGRSHVLGFISDVIATTPYAGDLLLGAQDAARQLGYIVLTANTGDDRELEIEEISALRRYQVDGFLYALMYHQRVHLPEAIGDVPTVVVDGEDEDGRVPSVFPDDLRIGYDATKRLIDAGCQRIAYFGASDAVIAQFDRFQGYKDALAEAGMAVDPVLLENTEEGRIAEAHAERLISEGKPDGIFCFNDRRVPALYHIAERHGLVVGRDLAIVGVDNQRIIGDMLIPELTTVELPHYDMGFEAVLRLVAMLDGPDDVRRLCEETGRAMPGDDLELRIHCRLLNKQSVPSSMNPRS